MHNIEHTPVPWNVAIHSDCDDVLNVIAGEQEFKNGSTYAHWIAELTVDDDPYEVVAANADFIVKAANCHTALVEALQYALTCLNELKKNYPSWHFFNYGDVSVDTQAVMALRKTA